MIRLAIVGTVLLGCPMDKLRAEDRILAAIQSLKPEVIISGGAKGVDAIAEEIANSLGYIEDDGSLVVFRPTVKRWHGPGGYKERDGLIAADCTHLLRVACKKSRTYGSGWTADTAERLGKTVVRHVVCA